MSDQQVISIVGPTATGKTDLALGLAELLVAQKNYAGVDFISADSRQVYQGLEIVSGADVPVNFELKDDGQFPFFEKNAIRLHGVSIIKPNDEWSVAHFCQFAQKIIKESWAENRLPILVGGTGLYHKHALSTDPRLHIGPNPKLRAQAETKSLVELQAWLQKTDDQAFKNMTESDQKNPRRLIRALERAVASPTAEAVDFPTQFEHQTFGLELPLAEIEQKIEQRVAQRFDHGAIEEVSRLRDNFKDQTLPVFSATGVAQILAYLSDDLTANEAQAQWSLKEFQYAKRQFTWWKKNQPDCWFEATDLDLPQKVSALL